MCACNSMPDILAGLLPQPAAEGGVEIVLDAVGRDAEHDDAITNRGDRHAPRQQVAECERLKRRLSVVEQELITRRIDGDVAAVIVRERRHRRRTESQLIRMRRVAPRARFRPLPDICIARRNANAYSVCVALSMNSKPRRTMPSLSTSTSLKPTRDDPTSDCGADTPGPCSSASFVTQKIRASLRSAASSRARPGGTSMSR